MRRVLVAADYSQLEVRIAAYMSQDPVMMDILRTGRDMHSATGAAIFNVAEASVGKSSPVRMRGKVTNFLVQFGGGPSKLIEGSEKLVLERPDLDLDIPTMEEARHAINSHKRLYKRYWDWTDWTKERARQLGYAETGFGRRWYIPNLNSAYDDEREAAGRQAVSEAIQGTAADLIKQAMVSMAHDAEMSRVGEMVLQVHDEIVALVDEDAVGWYEERITRHMVMGQPFEPHVELIVDCGHGDNWKATHK